MKEKIFIIGQGISGTLLSWFFHKADIPFVVIDSSVHNSASNTAAGIINPVTGRRLVTAWMDDLILPFAEKTYTELGRFLDVSVLENTSIIDFFPDPFMKENFLKRLGQNAPYLQLVNDKDDLKDYFNYEFGAGMIHPACIVHLQKLLPAWRNYLKHNGLLMDESFQFSQLQLKDKTVFYQGIRAHKVIFCEGVQASANPYFSLLPFAFNKGEALLIEAPGLPHDHIYKKSLTLAPLQDGGNLFWAGTNYIWDFEDDAPTESFKNATEKSLSHWLKIPFKTIDHKAAIRPATIERRPFAGFHPLHPHIGILNGMGTKGCSLAPFFAHQLVQHILYNQPIEKDADIQRHARLLMRV